MRTTQKLSAYAIGWSKEVKSQYAQRYTYRQLTKSRERSKAADSSGVGLYA